MTTEAILILLVSVTVVLAGFFGDYGPIETFKDAGPQLGAKIERSISIGHDFNTNAGEKLEWK